MPAIERMTVTMPAEMAEFVKSFAENGGYASTSEVVREAIRDLKAKHNFQLQNLAALRAEIDRGLADIAAGRVKDFDAEAIIARGRKLLADTPSA
jgi:antitoxin ParD1/3/4